jgi:hypothetical protein
MKNKYFLFSLLTNLLANCALAQETPWSGSWDNMEQVRAQPIKAVMPYPDWSWMFSIKGGAALIQNKETKTFYLAPGIEKSYAAINSNNVEGNFALFFGIQKILSPSLLGRIGIGAGFTTTTQLSGNIWDDADVQFNNFKYEYDLQHTQVTLDTKLLADVGLVVLPWISGSLGVGFNHASNFNSTPTVCGVLPIPNFTTQKTTGFTYGFGLGVEYPLREHLQIGLGYEFTRWGNNELGRAPEQTLNSGLSFNNIYSNGILLNLNYIV